MKYESEIRQLLINNAISLVASGGFESATTKALAHSGNPLQNAKMNDAYIYRIFGSKEDLFKAAFITLDCELIYAFRTGVEAVGGISPYSKEKLIHFFEMSWNFLLRNEERCRYYVRFYYSVYFKDLALVAHRKNMAEMVKEMTPLFKEEADVHAILHTAFTTLLDFAIRVYNGELENDETNRPHIFNVIYCMMSTYFKESIKQ